MPKTNEITYRNTDTSGFGYLWKRSFTTDALLTQKGVLPNALRQKSRLCLTRQSQSETDL